MSIYEQIKLLEEKIAKLPIGYISKKKINGKERYYRQWTEEGKIKSKYIKAGEYETVYLAIAKRRELEKELKELKDKLPKSEPIFETVFDYETNVMHNETLRSSCTTVSNYRKRDCYAQLQNYIYGNSFGKVCAVYGLRRTGKTTMLFQSISELPLEQTAYIKLTVNDNMAMLNRDLKKLTSRGYKYVFLDEVTLLEDFIDSAALFSDIYAMQGIKIIMSGTDSLGFWFTEHDELYDRVYTIHTTFIPFREHSRLLDIHDIDEYIRYGGTLRAGEVDFDNPEVNADNASFRDQESTRRYIDTAICKNIQHSLAHCENGGHFRHLIDLYDAGELTNAINRIIEDINHSFLARVIDREFRSTDLSITRKNLRKETNESKQSDVLDRIDESSVIERLRKLLYIKEKDELTVKITPAHIAEIKEYLRALDLIIDCPTKTMSSESPIEHILFTQPGMRYCQAQALIHSLLKDSTFNDISEKEKTMVTQRILDEVKGRMMEDIILLECSKVADKNQNVFKLMFDRGEFDMVIYNQAEDTCAVFEIKHSNQEVAKQYQHLTDSNLCEQTERRFGNIIRKYVLYRGESHTNNDNIIYINAASFLEQLPDSMYFEQEHDFTMDLL